MPQILSSTMPQKQFDAPGEFGSEEMERNEVVLIVDDNPRNLYAMKAVLDQAYRDVVIMESSTQALAYLDKNPVDLLLLDVQMPAPDGYETAEIIRSRRKFDNLSIIFVTAVFKSTEYIQRGFQAGGQDYLSKPVDSDLLRNKVNIFLRLHHQHHQLATRADALELSNSRMKAISELSPDGFIFIDETQVIQYLNPAVERLLATDRNQLLGSQEQALDTLLHAQLQEGSEHYIEIDKLGSGNSDILRLHNRRQLIIHREVRDFISKKGLNQGRVIYLRDVTREIEIDRMKSEFLSTAAHELRTPMSSIYGFTELLLLREYPQEKRQEVLHTIHSQAAALTHLLNELLDLARIEARAGKDFEFKCHNVGDLVAEVTHSLIIDDIDSPPLIDIQKPAEMHYGLIDASKIKQALINILANSIKYSIDQPVITIELDTRGEEGSKIIAVRVSDQGIGMTAGQTEQVFDRFYRADTSGKVPGTGLGMALVKEIITLHKGEVSINSELGKGTSVEITFPACETHFHPLAEGLEQAQESNASGILLSDENQDRIYDSWLSLSTKKGRLGDTFYQQLFKIDPPLRALFPQDLSSLIMQFETLLSTMINLLKHSEELETAVFDLGRRHADYGVKDEHFESVGKAFLAAVEQGLKDEGKDLDTVKDWALLYHYCTTIMKRGLGAS